MCKVVIKPGILSAASALHARCRRANDNVNDVPMAAGAEPCGAFTPVGFDNDCTRTVVHASRQPGMPAVVQARRVTLDREPLVSNDASHSSLSGPLARLWATLSREWTVARAASKLGSMSDLTLSDIGVQRGDIDFVVRFGRSMDAGPQGER